MQCTALGASSLPGQSPASYYKCIFKKQNNTICKKPPTTTTIPTTKKEQQQKTRKPHTGWSSRKEWACNTQKKGSEFQNNGLALELVWVQIFLSEDDIHKAINFEHFYACFVIT